MTYEYDESIIFGKCMAVCEETRPKRLIVSKLSDNPLLLKSLLNER